MVHLSPYGPNGYTYIWSKTIAVDLLTRFEAQGLRSRVVAEDYRRRVLAPGSSKPAAKLVEDFLGRPTSLEAYRNRMSISN